MPSCLVVLKKHYFSHNLCYYNLSSQPGTNNLISSGFDEGSLTKKAKRFVIGSLSQCIVIGEQLRWCFSTATPSSSEAGKHLN